MQRRKFFKNMALGTGSITIANGLSAEEANFNSAALPQLPSLLEQKTLPRLNPQTPAAVRLWEASVIQANADFFQSAKYVRYIREASDEEAAQTEKEYEILKLYNESLDRIIKEASAAKPAANTVEMWLLYGQGFVIKTPTACFGIDIHHRHAERLAPILDFALSTHKHLDHYSTPHIEAMEKLGKPYISNFVDNKYKTLEAKDWQFGEIKITARPSDHPGPLENFVLNYEIDCGKSAGNCMIFHSGDAYIESQLQPKNHINVLITHVQGELDLPKFVNRIKPDTTLISHIYELSWVMYRWSMASALKRCAELGENFSYPPIWGEKFTWKKS